MPRGSLGQLSRDVCGRVQARKQEERVRHNLRAAGRDESAVTLLDRGLRQLQKGSLHRGERAVSREQARDLPERRVGLLTPGPVADDEQAGPGSEVVHPTSILQRTSSQGVRASSRRWSTADAGCASLAERYACTEAATPSSAEWWRATYARPAETSDCRSSGRLSRRTTVAVIADGSAGGTRRPVSPWIKTS